MNRTLSLIAILLATFTSIAQNQDCDVTLPFTDSFENDSVLSPCWTVVLADSNSSLPLYGVTTETASDGSQSLMLIPLYSSNYNLYLITPELPVSGTKSVSFDHRGYWYTETFVVGYSTTTDDISAFTWGETVQSPAVDAPWNNYLNVSIPGNAKYVAIHHTSSNGFALYIDNFAVSEASTCMAPADLAVIQVTATSADLTWTQSSDGTDITLYYVSGDDTAANEISSVYLADGIYTLEGLTPGNQYSWMLSVICDNDTLFSTISSFTTPCESVTLPYMEDFDNVATNDIPACWTQINPYNGFPKVTTSHSHSGKSLEFRCYYSADNGVYAVLPPFATDLSEIQLSFWTRRENTSSGILSVGYMTDLNNTASFVPIRSISADQIGDNSYHFFNVHFNNVTTDPDSSYFLAFEYKATSAWYWYVDDITVEEIPDCIAPQDLTVNEVTHSTANLSWTGYSELYSLYYKADYDTLWTVISDITIDTNGYTLDNLNFGTTYQWYVAAICNDSTQENSTIISSFTTNCSTTSTPYAMDFDYDGSLSDCWKRYTGSANNAFAGSLPTSTSSGWVFSNTNVFGQYHATLNIYGTSRYFWLVSPAVDLDGLADPNLSFHLALTDNNNSSPIENLNGQADDKFMVIISTDDGASWSASNATVWSNDGNGDYSFNQISSIGEVVNIPLTNYAGETVRIAFYGESSVSNGNNDLHIDNVTFDEAPACAIPSQLTVSNVTDTSADISWTENGGSTSWLVEYFPENGSYGTPTESVIVTDTPFVTLQDLQPNVYHQITVRAICLDGSYSSAVYGGFKTTLPPTPLPFTTNFSTGTEQEWQFNDRLCSNWWAIGTVNNNGALYVAHNSTNPEPAYGTSSSTVISAVKPLVVGTNSEIKVSFDVMIGGESHFDFLKLFLSPDSMEYPAASTTFNISYGNANYASFAYDFTDYLPYSTYHSYPYKFNLTGGSTIHIDAVMPNPYNNPTSTSVAKLVFLWRNDSSGGTQPGAVISNLSVTPVTCTQPVNLTVGTVTENSAVISWQPGGTETDWNVLHKANADSVWTVTAVSATTYTLTGLSPMTSYSVRVQADCGGGDLSYFSSATFTTDSMTVILPSVVTDIVSSVTETAAVLNGVIADLGNVAINDRGFEWKPASADSFSSVSAIDGYPLFSCLINNLTPNTSYIYKAFLTTIDTILYGQEMTFTTLSNNDTVEDRINEYLSNSITIFPNPTNDHINIQCTLDNEQYLSVEVIDVYGKVVRTIAEPLLAMSPHPRINVSDLTAGMYIVRVTTKEGIVAKTFVKR